MDFVGKIISLFYREITKESSVCGDSFGQWTFICVSVCAFPMNTKVTANILILMRNIVYGTVKRT